MRNVFVFVLALTCVAAQPSDDAVKKDLKEFQGKWTAEYAQGNDGNPLPDEELKTMTLVVEGNKFKLNSKDTTIEGEFKIDPTKKIKTIDVFVGEDRTKPIVLGIYEIKGDIRRSCFGDIGKDRPDAFRKEKGYVFLQWKRAK